MIDRPPRCFEFRSGNEAGGFSFSCEAMILARCSARFRRVCNTWTVRQRITSARVIGGIAPNGHPLRTNHDEVASRRVSGVDHPNKSRGVEREPGDSLAHQLSAVLSSLEMLRWIPASACFRVHQSLQYTRQTWMIHTSQSTPLLSIVAFKFIQFCRVFERLLIAVLVSSW